MSYAIGNNDAAKDKAAMIMQLSPFAGKFDEYRGVYTSRYAYIRTLEGPFRLFDNIVDPLQMNNLVGKPGYVEIQQKLEAQLQQELMKVGDEFKPRQYYIDKWNYTLTKGGYIDYSKNAAFQGPGLNKR